MRIWVAYRIWDYDGFQAIGAYDSQEKAEAAIAEDERIGGIGPDSWEYEEFEVA